MIIIRCIVYENAWMNNVCECMYDVGEPHCFICAGFDTFYTTQLLPGGGKLINGHSIPGKTSAIIDHKTPPGIFPGPTQKCMKNNDALWYEPRDFSPY